MSLLISINNSTEPGAPNTAVANSGSTNIISFGGDEEYTSLADFEAKELAKPEEERYGRVAQWIIKKMIVANQRDFTEEDLLKGFFSLIPKVLFFYLPLFAFWLWLFHNKRRWYFFDHGIFTLHYFSFLLLLFSISLLLLSAISLIPNTGIVNGLSSVIFIIIILYPVIYFFRAHSRMYGEKIIISFLKSLLLFVLNLALIIIFLSTAFVYAFITIH
jgi:hypothetical protein